MVLVFVSILNYLIDSHTVFAASVLAANSVLRSLFGAAFPPVHRVYMYADLGVHWAFVGSAFLALACVPFSFPWLRMRLGHPVRAAVRQLSLQPSWRDYSSLRQTWIELQRSRRRALRDLKSRKRMTTAALLRADEATYAPITASLSKVFDTPPQII